MHSISTPLPLPSCNAQAVRPYSVSVGYSRRCSKGSDLAISTANCFGNPETRPVTGDLPFRAGLQDNQLHPLSAVTLR